MTWVATAIVGSALIGGYASNRAASTQAQAAQQGIDAQERMFNRQVELQEPFRKAGEEALNKLIPLASNYTPFGTSQFQQDPGYAFRLSEGIKALDRSAASRGGLLSGATLKGAQRYGQDLGSQEYQNAFNRYQIERNAQLNPLQSLAGVGQTATNTLTGAAGQMGQNLATGYGNVANARASGYVGATNALTSALGTGLNYMQNQQLIGRLPSSNSLGYGGLPSYSGAYGGTQVTPGNFGDGYY
ncbi:MAG: DNA transfer protein p32 [Actinobacteria bacterium]|nr:DNA transfer protein p32 [Actinomycetota bacterium]